MDGLRQNNTMLPWLQNEYWNNTHAETSSCTGVSPFDEFRLRVITSQLFEVTPDIIINHSVAITRQWLSSISPSCFSVRKNLALKFTNKTYSPEHNDQLLHDFRNVYFTCAVPKSI